MNNPPPLVRALSHWCEPYPPAPALGWGGYGKLDYLKSGFGKCAFLNFTLFSSMLKISLQNLKENPWPPFGGVVAEVKRWKSINPRKLDYLKSGFGKIAFCSFTLFSSIMDFYSFGFSEFNFAASLWRGVLVQGCDRAWRVGGIMELKIICWIASFR